MDYNILTPLVPFLLGILLKIFLDFNLAFFIIKYFYWFPVRNIFRTKPENISGDWKQLWGNSISENYQSDEARLSKLQIKQLGNYIYGEFRSNNDEEYYIFAEIIGKNIVGKWGDRKNNLGYFGAVELRIVNSNSIVGIWLGHSNSKPDQINHDQWKWER